jgi:lipopolysaccharide transport system permease protein
VDTFFTFVAMLVLNMFVGVWPNIYFVYLPILFLIQLVFTVALMFFISYLSVVIRDLPQFIGVILQLMFFLTPIVYAADHLPESVRNLIYINPLAVLITAYREVILYGRAPDLAGLIYPFVISCVLLYTGYLFFKSNEPKLTDYI